MAGTYVEKGRLADAEILYRSILVGTRLAGQPLFEPEFSFSREQRVSEDYVSLEAKANYGLGLVFSYRGDLNSGIQYYRKAISILPGLSEAWANLGVAFLRKKEFRQAADALFNAVQLDSSQYLYWFNYGVALEQINRLDQARESYEKCLTLRPDFTAARQRLMRLKQR